MSTNKTPNYDLHSWVPQDDFHMTEINENFAKLDTALKTEAQTAAQGRSALQTALNEKASTSSVTALQTALNGKANAATVTALSQQLAGKADASTVTALSQQLATRPRIATGTYVGIYSKSDTTPTTIELGVRPLLVLISTNNGTLGYYQANTGGFATQDLPLGNVLVLGETGFTVRNGNPVLNESALAYRYLVFY